MIEEPFHHIHNYVNFRCFIKHRIMERMGGKERWVVGRVGVYPQIRMDIEAKFYNLLNEFKNG